MLLVSLVLTVDIQVVLGIVLILTKLLVVEVLTELLVVGILTELLTVGVGTFSMVVRSCWMLFLLVKSSRA